MNNTEKEMGALPDTQFNNNNNPIIGEFKNMSIEKENLINNEQSQSEEIKKTQSYVDCGLCTYSTENNQDNEVSNYFLDTLKNTVSIIGLNEFLNSPYEEIEYLLSPILRHPSLTMIYAKAGVGKTFFTLQLALCLSHGESIHNWIVQKPRKVLYVDGEMSSADMKARLTKLLNPLDEINPELHSNLQLCLYGYPKDQTELEFGKEEFRNQFTEENLSGKIDVLILDNLSSLVRAEENENDAWQPFNKWCIRLRKKGISVILLHHENKTSGMRGASNKLDGLDYVIHLEEKNGIITGTFEKCRNIPASLAVPFSFKIEDLDNNAIWLNFSAQKTPNSRTDYRPIAKILFKYLLEKVKPEAKEKMTFDDLEMICGKNMSRSSIQRLVTEKDDES